MRLDAKQSTTEICSLTLSGQSSADRLTADRTETGFDMFPEKLYIYLPLIWRRQARWLQTDDSCDQNRPQSTSPAARPPLQYESSTTTRHHTYNNSYYTNERLQQRAVTRTTIATTHKRAPSRWQRVNTCLATDMLHRLATNMHPRNHCNSPYHAPPPTSTYPWPERSYGENYSQTYEHTCTLWRH